MLTPIAKSWPSQWCLAANDLAIQVHGGYGYTRDYAVEQFYRDNRLNPIHEGTHGIQALDLLGRKVVMDGGAGLRAARRDDRATTAAARAGAEAAELRRPTLDAAVATGSREVDRDALGRRRPGRDAGQRLASTSRRSATSWSRGCGWSSSLAAARPDGRLLRGQAAAAPLLLPLRAAAHRTRSSTCWRALDRTTLDMRRDWF